METLAVPPSPLVSLPVELFDMIFYYTILDLLDRMSTHQIRPTTILSSFCSLSRVCKTFKIYLDRAHPNIGLRYNRLEDLPYLNWRDGNLYVPFGFCKRDDDLPVTWRPRTWGEIFQRYQLWFLHRAIEGARDEFPSFAKLARVQVGQLWFNPCLKLSDFVDLGNIFGDSSFIYLILGPTLHRVARPLQEFDAAESFQEFLTTMLKDDLDFAVDEIDRVSHSFRQYHYGFSVKKWRLGGRFDLTQDSIAPEVSEWWIFGYRIIPPLLVGYHEGKSYVFETFAGHLYTNFDPSKISGFGEARENLNGLHNRYWVSMWPVPRRSTHSLLLSGNVEDSKR